MNIVLVDFGFATCRDIHKLKCYIGTRPYMPPEVIRRDVLDGRAADVFSLGVMMFQIVLGRFPFNNAEESDKYFKIILDEKVGQYK
jgi:serine/threonine protein kinase